MSTPLLLNNEHLRIYGRYLGQVDAFARSSCNSEKQAMPKDAWVLLYGLIARLNAEDEDDAFDGEFVAETTQQINQSCETKEVAIELRQLARDEAAWTEKRDTKRWWQFWK